MGNAVTDGMTDQRRALLTEREREILSEEADVTDNYRYSVESRVRKRLRDRLADDVDLIRQEYPEMFDDLIFPAVCQPADVDEEKQSTTDDTVAPSNPEAVEMQTTEPDIEPASDLPADVTDEVREAVERVARSWEDSDERLRTRKDAAAAVLQHALDTDEAVGKSSDIVAEVRANYHVEGQNEETYWRKNIRPVLKAHGDYNQGRHGYTVEEVRND